jgi:phosphoribosylamine--glycine ligase
MNVLTLLASDLGEVAWRCVDGNLGPSAVSFEKAATVCKYLVPEGYPEAAGPPAPIGLGDPGPARLYYANVEERDGGLWTLRSRTLAFVGTGATLEEAEGAAERAASGVTGPVRYRRDIGTQALLEQRCAHMRAIR